MPYRPGTAVTTRTSPTARSGASLTGVWFVVGAAERGPLDKPQTIRNMTEFDRYFGTRITQSLLFDSLDTFFREGGNTAVVQRVAGPSATTAGLTLTDASDGNSLRVAARDAGAWGGQLSVAVQAGATSGQFVIVVTHAARGVVDRSPSLASQADAIAWANDDERWVKLTLPSDASSLNPKVVAATALTGGTDDYGAVSDTVRAAGLTKFTTDFGPGQVSVPGSTTPNTRASLIAHARAFNRQALLDVVDTSSASVLVSEAQGLQGDEYGALFGPWITVPNPQLAGAVRVVPPSALAAGLLARSDATRSPNEAAAGTQGRAKYALGLTQAPYTDAERDSLNTAGLNLLRAFDGVVTLYANRTLARATDPTWGQLTNQRLRMVIVSDAEAIAESFLFQQIDGKGQKLAEFAGALTGMLTRHYNARALYGDTPGEAFYVDVSNSVNTPQTIENGELHAVIGVRMSPTAEYVEIQIVKTAISQSF
jgi:hypothetical protein